MYQLQDDITRTMTSNKQGISINKLITSNINTESERKSENSEVRPTDSHKHKKYELQIVWKNVFLFIYLHLAALYGVYLILSSTSKLYTVLWAIYLGIVSAFSITAGAHRLWSHRAYKAKWPLRVILAVFHTATMQNSIYEWCRDHRVHHKFSETDADPHNAARGFFFSHIGWLMCRKHPDVIRKGSTVDMSDLEQDPMIMWQKKYYVILSAITGILIPAFVPWYFWEEQFWYSLHVAGIDRIIFTLHFTWAVNSIAHMFGNKPFDKNVGAVDNKILATFTLGAGWHNYHHVFPWDYKSAELGNYGSNLTTALIDFFAKIGWAYDLKSVPVELVRKRAERTGDRSRKHSNDATHIHQEPEETQIWGLGDADMSIEDTRAALRGFKEL